MQGRTRIALLTATLGMMVAHAEGKLVGSTLDEWADRFLPEAGPKIELPAYADQYDRAGAEVSAGKYRAALGTVASIPAPDAKRVAMLRADALQGLGETDAAYAALSGEGFTQDVDVLTLTAQLALENQNLPMAMKSATAAVAVRPDSLRARLLVGQTLEQSGQYDEAIAAYHWFIEGPQAYLQKWQTDPDQFESADDVCDIATAIHRWATLTMAYKDGQSLNDTVLNMYIRSFDVIDRAHVDSRILAARFLMERGNVGAASKYLDPLEHTAPTNRHVLQLTAEAAMESGAEPALRQVAGAMRQNDPDSVDAAILDIIAAAHPQPSVAAGLAQALYDKHPTRLDVIGLHAALQYIVGDEQKLDALLAKAEQIVPKGTTAMQYAAMLLEMKTQRDQAIRLLTTIIDRTPWDTSARHMLGDIYLNDGMDNEAKAVLDEAYKLDPYNVKTVNYSRLLDELAKYEKFRTDHLVVYYDRDLDPVTADQIGPFMERTYADVTKLFEYEPKTKVIVQVFPDDAEFSVRMAGVPGVENYGVSFGRVLATVAPRAGTKKGNFNWARVLRHEFVHTINLLQTKERCPRWLTEGLAVWQEGVPFRFDGVPREMWTRAMDGKLFTIRGLSMAFIRPRSGNDGEQAYTQGSWLARYMEATYGRESIVKLLNAYGQSKSNEEAFQLATGVPLSEFEPAWHAWVIAQIKPWNYDTQSDRKAEVLAKEGDAFIKAKKWDEAIKVWEAAYQLQPTELKPHQRLAYLYLQKDINQPEKAIEHLKFLHIFELSNNRFAKQVSKLYARQNDLPNAIEWALQSTYVDLYDASAHEMLAELYDKAGDRAKAQAARQIVSQIKLWEQKRKQPDEEKKPD